MPGFFETTFKVTGATYMLAKIMLSYKMLEDGVVTDVERASANDMLAFAMSLAIIGGGIKGALESLAYYFSSPSEGSHSPSMGMR